MKQGDIIKITKIGSVENPYHKDSTFGESAPFHKGIFYMQPVVGFRFNAFAISDKHGERGISTSPVTEVNGGTFKTLNSIYKIELYETI